MFGLLEGADWTLGGVVDQTLFRCSYFWHGLHNRCGGFGQRSAVIKLWRSLAPFPADLGELQAEERAGVAEPE